MTVSSSTTVSAPGKVLLAGGYLVLKNPHVGLVFAVNKRFYCTVDSEEVADATVEAINTIDTKNDTSGSILVESPQFQSTWNYKWHCRHHSKQEEASISLVPCASNKSSNAFVEQTLRVLCAFLHTQTQTSALVKLPSNLNIRIFADNEFYSSSSTTTKFIPVTNAQKTGLGSSAALVTSLVGAVLQHLTKDLCYTYNLAQLAHCQAQGKVGSGFDISSAVHGSHVYQRFPKCLLPDILAVLDKKDDISTSTCQLLSNIIRQPWSGGVQCYISLPKGLTLLLADVGGGSESPSMASKVLAWNHANPQNPYWESLATCNAQVVELFLQLKDTSTFPVTMASEWESECPTLYQLHICFRSIRTLLKAMGDAAGVPIEPPSQTLLANKTMELPGVVTTLVPGAGGYDALACLCLSTVRDNVIQTWNNMGSNISPMDVKVADREGGLQVEHDFVP